MNLCGGENVLHLGKLGNNLVLCLISLSTFLAQITKYEILCYSLEASSTTKYHPGRKQNLG